MPNEQSKTPETDAETVRHCEMCGGESVDVDFARKLEVELNALGSALKNHDRLLVEAQRERDEAKKEFELLKKIRNPIPENPTQLADYARRLIEAECEVKQLRKVCDELADNWIKLRREVKEDNIRIQSMDIAQDVFVGSIYQGVDKALESYKQSKRKE